MLKPISALVLGASLLAAPPLLAGDSGRQPSADLRNLERDVSLKLAHVRDEGLTDPRRREQLHQAQQLDLQAEHAISSGNYDAAEESLVKANAILGQLAQ